MGRDSRRGIASRRRLLSVLGTAGTLGLAGCKGQSSAPTETSTTGPTQSPGTSTPTTTAGETWDLDPIEHDRLVGAYYYPWYEQSEGWQDWTDMVPGEPVLGEYNSADRDVINQHIKWAREHGINWFNVSWAGPAGRSAGFHDRVLQDEFLEAELGDKIQFSLLYESNLQFETHDGGRMDLDVAANRGRLRSDFEHLSETYFDKPTYLTVDGRPVVTMYTAHDFHGAVAEAFQDAKDAIGHDTYLVASVLGGGDPAGLLNGVNADWMDEFDAATAYGLYDAAVAESGDYSDFVEYVDRTSRKWALAAEHMGVDFIPNVIPGYDDTLIPDRDRVPIERDADGFRELCRIVRDRMDPDLDAVLVTSFNEWPEYTSVEPAESYGTKYLEIVLDELATTEPDYFDVGAHPLLQLRFDRTLPAPEEPSIEFAMQLGELALKDEAGEPVRTYDVGVPQDEPYLLEGAYGPPARGGPLETWRWLGGSTKQTTIYLDPECAGATGTDLYGMAPSFAERPVGVDVYMNGERVDHVDVASEPATYAISLETSG